MKRRLIGVIALAVATAFVGCGADPFVWRTPIPQGGSVDAVSLDGESAWVTVWQPFEAAADRREVWKVGAAGSELVESGAAFVAETDSGVVIASSDGKRLMVLSSDSGEVSDLLNGGLVAFDTGVGVGDTLVVSVGLLEDPDDNLSSSVELWGVDVVSGQVLWRDGEFRGSDQISSVGGNRVVLTSRTAGFGVEVFLVDPETGSRELILDPDTWKSRVSGVGGCVLGYREQLEPGADYLYVVEDICEGGRQEFAWGEAGWTGLGDRWLVGDGDELIAIDVGGPGATSYLVRVPLGGLDG